MMDGAKIEAVAAVLGKWAGTPARGIEQVEGEEQYDLYVTAMSIVRDDEDQVRRPDAWEEDMARAAKHADRLRAILLLLNPVQAGFFSKHMRNSGLYHEPTEWGVDHAIDVLNTIVAAALSNEEVARDWKNAHPPEKRNANWRNRDVPLVVAYFQAYRTESTEGRRYRSVPGSSPAGVCCSSQTLGGRSQGRSQGPARMDPRGPERRLAPGLERRVKWMNTAIWSDSFN